MGALEHPSIEESVAGVRGILFQTPSPVGTSGTASLRVEAAEAALYGIAGLHVSGLRAEVRTGAVSLVAEAAVLASDVGRETRVALTPAVFVSGRWAASLGLIHETAAVEGLPAARLLSVTGRSLVRLSGRMSVGGEVSRYRLCAEANDGADLQMAVIVTPIAGALIRAVVDIGRWAGAQPSISATVASPGGLRLSLGYEAGTEALKGALAVGLRALTCAAGAHRHPVLGSRYGVTLSWEW
jgi:hypothetical protein